MSQLTTDAVEEYMVRVQSYAKESAEYSSSSTMSSHVAAIQAFIDGNIKTSLRKKCSYSELFWSAFFQHFPVVGPPYLVRMRENAGKMWTRITPNTTTFYAVYSRDLETKNLIEPIYLQTLQSKSIDTELNTKIEDLYQLGMCFEL